MTAYGRRQAAAAALASRDMAVTQSPTPPAARRLALAVASAFVAGILAVLAFDPALSDLPDRILLGVNVAWFAGAALYLRKRPRGQSAAGWRPARAVRGWYGNSPTTRRRRAAASASATGSSS